MAKAIEARLDAKRRPRWVTFVDLTGSRVRLRARRIEYICQCTAEQRTAERAFFRSLKREFVPPEDRGYFVSIILAPEGSTVNYTDQYQRQIEQILARTPDIESFFSIIGFGGRVNRGIIFTRLTDWENRDRMVWDVIGEVQPQYFAVPGVLAFASNPPAFGGFSSPVQFVVQNADFDRLILAMDTLTKRARAIPGLVNVDTDLRVNKPELTVTFDRQVTIDAGPLS